MLTGCQIGCSIELSLISGRSEGIFRHASHSVVLTAARIVPKLRAESDVYMGPGPAPTNAKKGTVDVHRGGAVCATSEENPFIHKPIEIHTNSRISCAKRSHIPF